MCSISLKVRRMKTFACDGYKYGGMQHNGARVTSLPVQGLVAAAECWGIGLINI